MQFFSNCIILKECDFYTNIRSIHVYGALPGLSKRCHNRSCPLRLEPQYTHKIIN